jgi:predicted phage-related endonuclease
VYAKFKINQEEIIKTICVQRTLPTNTCQGHCALKKSLKQLEDNEKEMQNNLKEKTELVYIQNSSETNLSLELNISSTRNNYNYFGKKPITVVMPNFRPPSYFI